MIPPHLSPLWHPVADRVPNTSRTDRWDWRITYAERVLLLAAVGAGTALTAQRHEAGGMVLVAKGARAGTRMARKSLATGSGRVLEAGMGIAPSATPNPARAALAGGGR